MARAESGAYAVLVAYSNSRLTRRPREWDRLITLSEQHGVGIHTVASGSADLSRADGRAVARTIAAWDAAEAERISERVARAVRQRAESGLWHGGHVPHGYLAVERDDGSGNTLVIDPATAPLMREAAGRLLAGESLYAIAHDFNSRGLHTSKGSHWRSQTIRKAMLSPSIIGMRQVDDTLHPGSWEPLLDRKTWDRLQDLLLDPKRKFGPIDGNYGGKRALGGGLTVCAVCGRRLVSARFRGEIRLACHKVATGGCGGVVIKYDPFEEWVLDLVMARLDSPTFRREIAKPRVRQLGEEDRLRLELRGLDVRWERARAAYEAGAYELSELTRVRAEIADERTRITEELQSRAADNVLDGITSGTDARSLWEAADVTRKRRFLASLIEEIRVERWPAGMATTLTRRSSKRIAARNGRSVETEREFAERREAHMREALRRRVDIKWRSSL